jgi:hypothetical protein
LALGAHHAGRAFAGDDFPIEVPGGDESILRYLPNPGAPDATELVYLARDLVLDEASFPETPPSTRNGVRRKSVRVVAATITLKGLVRMTVSQAVASVTIACDTLVIEPGAVLVLEPLSVDVEFAARRVESRGDDSAAVSRRIEQECKVSVGEQVRQCRESGQAASVRSASGAETLRLHLGGHLVIRQTPAVHGPPGSSAVNEGDRSWSGKVPPATVSKWTSFIVATTSDRMEAAFARKDERLAFEELRSADALIQGTLASFTLTDDARARLDDFRRRTASRLPRVLVEDWRIPDASGDRIVKTMSSADTPNDLLVMPLCAAVIPVDNSPELRLARVRAFTSDQHQFIAVAVTAALGVRARDRIALANQLARRGVRVVPAIAPIQWATGTCEVPGVIRCQIELRGAAEVGVEFICTEPGGTEICRRLSGDGVAVRLGGVAGLDANLRVEETLVLSFSRIAADHLRSEPGGIRNTALREAEVEWYMAGDRVVDCSPPVVCRRNAVTSLPGTAGSSVVVPALAVRWQTDLPNLERAFVLEPSVTVFENLTVVNRIARAPKGGAALCDFVEVTVTQRAGGVETLRETPRQLAPSPAYGSELSLRFLSLRPQGHVYDIHVRVSWQDGNRSQEFDLRDLPPGAVDVDWP